MPASLLETPVGDVQVEVEARPRSEKGLNVGRVVTALLVGGPLVGLILFIVFGWGGPVTVWAAVLALGFYLLTGLGVTVGFHRLFAHHSFRANRALKVILAVTGSMAMEGSVIGWVAVHRRHHVFSDQPGDPHSPWGRGDGAWGMARGFLWAHVGWLFAGAPTDAKRFAPELRRDRDLVVVDRLFPVLAVVSLAAPSHRLCHHRHPGRRLRLLPLGRPHPHGPPPPRDMEHQLDLPHLGRRPFVTGDQSTNVAPLALVSFGESWHNFHHAAPASARHGVLAHQFDLSAEVIRVFERVGWATKVRWPTSASIAALMVPVPVGSI